jgi:hypothetical protein
MPKFAAIAKADATKMIASFAELQRSLRYLAAFTAPLGYSRTP